MRGGAIVGEGWNRIYANHDPTAHGKIEAIRNACRRVGARDLSGAGRALGAARNQRHFAAQPAAMRDQAFAAGDQAYGAVVVKDGRVVGLGPSRVVTRPAMPHVRNHFLLGQYPAGYAGP